ncbi:hypothetical protein [Bradyrhizobium sp.]|jgi:hypothetical protein|uniref:hypothetical protein n=1 Tax=Bradyrhizobium sp. TaxID=376 RepID=UPI002E0B0EDB|nr:hypothetical protein [Bradyrhizobium sp.]
MDSYETGKAEASSAAAAQASRPLTVSGLYQGEMMLPQPGRFELELRVDIDPRNLISPVMNRVSGDLFQVTRTNLPGQPPQISRTYIESWIVDRPVVTPSTDHIDVTGTVRFWVGTHAATTVALRISWPGSPPAVGAEATFTETGRATRKYSCRRISDSFRNVSIEVDVCASINTSPLLPNYDTSWHDDHPADLPHRVLTVESAYEEAGVHVTISPDHTVIDDSAAAFRSWTTAELHDAMETHFSQIGGTWPNWKIWGLMAGTFEDSLVGGIMFDAAAAGTGATGSERQGFAVFRKHEWFDDLVTETPQNQKQAEAARQFLYTWVHEAGHAYNFLHSWDKGRPDSLSWMNYDWRYEQRNGERTFWKRFAFRFDDDELIHLRHGNRAAVIMGGDPWSSGSHLEAPNLSMTQIEGKAALELIVRSKGYFDLMEPVLVELRLRNLLSDAAVMIDKRLQPEYGGVAIYIQKPDGQVIQYDPVICAVGGSEMLSLAAAGTAEQGRDRYSREIFLSYGSSSFYFDQPGDYRIRAVYQGPGDVLIPSEAHRIRIGAPVSKEIDRKAQDYFTDDVGLTLYLQGSRSPHLEKGVDVLKGLADQYKDTALGAKIAVTLANGVSKPFYRMPDAQSKKMVRTSEADPEQALKMTESALNVYRNDDDKSSNLGYSRIVQRRADYHEEAGNPGQAKQELETLAQDLSARGANAPTVERYQRRADQLPDSNGKRPAAAPSRVRAPAAPRKKRPGKPRGRST